MILRSLLPRIVHRALAASTVLDVGGWQSPLNAATHGIDLFPFETRGNALDPDVPVRGSAANWTIRDIHDTPWPYPDGFFDFSFCSHTLEDVRDPIAVVRELARVAKAGYVEVPSRVREMFVKHRFAGLRRLVGRPPDVGFDHHRWYARFRAPQLTFFGKPCLVASSPRFHITRAAIGRKLAEAESGLGIFWQGALTATESSPPDLRADAADFRNRAVRALRARRLDYVDFGETADIFDPDTALGLWPER